MMGSLCQILPSYTSDLFSNKLISFLSKQRYLQIYTIVQKENQNEDCGAFLSMTQCKDQSVWHATAVSHQQCGGGGFLSRKSSVVVSPPYQCGPIIAVWSPPHNPGRPGLHFSPGRHQLQATPVYYVMQCIVSCSVFCTAVYYILQCIVYLLV